jgi:membrane peptidoglycan carboxypeptidase
MASRRPRKSAPRKRAPARKRVPTRKRTPARKRPAARKSGARGRPGRKKAARKHSPLFKLVFWPFLLVGRLTLSWPAILRWPARAAGGLAVIGLTIFLVGATIYYVRSLRFDLARVAEMPARSTILDRRGKELGRLHGANRYIVSLDDVSPNFRNALLAREDKRFYSHFGVDPIGIARAVKENITRRRFAQGASTISMQLSRNAFHLLTDGAWWEELDRKFLELALTFRIEARYSKDEILQHYMNLIFWGGSVHGIEAASRTYLEKPARDLTLSEGAMLAGIIRAPNAFSPFEDLRKTKRERDTTLDSMVKYGFVTKAQAGVARAEPLHIRPKHRRIIHDSYAMDAIRRDLERILEKQNIKLGGLTITTTIDQNLQHSAERALDKHLRSIERQSGFKHQTRLQWQNQSASERGTPQYLQGAVVLIENRTGAVLGVVGGRNADESKFNRALHAKRQIGSVFKPFVYLSAFNEGLLPDTYISDDRIRPGQIKGAPKDWSPANSDGKYYKSIKVREGLVNSRNTSSVRVGNFAGLSEVRKVAHQAGFTTKMPKTPASFLGSWEATPWEVASAYTLFPNDGRRFRPYLIQEIRNRQGKVLYRTDPLDYPAARPGAASGVSSILEEVTARGTASAIRSKYGFQHPAGGKTGTTDNYVDAWFVGYTSSVTCAVWVGLDQPKTIMPGGYGSRLALPVWVETMKTADRLQRYNFGSLKSDFPSTPCRLCHYSGKRATPGCESAGTAYSTKLPSDLIPGKSDFCAVHPLRAAPVGTLPPARSNSRPPPRAVPVKE